MGRATVENLNLRELAAQELSYLSNETNEAVYLAVRENLSVVYIDKIDSQKPIRSWNTEGGTAPLHCVGTGKAILAADYSKLRNQISKSLEQYTEKTKTKITQVDADVKSTLAKGYAFDDGEYRERVISLGAAIKLPGGEPVGALGISLPDINLPEDGVELYGALVAHAAASVSVKLGKT